MIFRVIAKLVDGTEWECFRSGNEEECNDIFLQIHNILNTKDNEFVSISMQDSISVHRLNVFMVYVEEYKEAPEATIKNWDILS